MAPTSVTMSLKLRMTIAARTSLPVYRFDRPARRRPPPASRCRGGRWRRRCRSSERDRAGPARARATGAARWPRWAVEPLGHVASVGPLRRAVSPSSTRGRTCFQQAPVRRRLGVMELVNDNHVELLRPHRRQPIGVQALDRGEHMAPLGRPPASNPHLTKGPVSHDRRECQPALIEDLPPMGHEQQGQPAQFLHQPAVVEGRDHCLASPGGRHHQVPPPPVDLALDIELVEHRLLVGVGAHLQAGDRDRRRTARTPEGSVQAGPVGRGRRSRNGDRPSRSRTSPRTFAGGGACRLWTGARFHSRPSIRAERDRLDDPTYPVSHPESRRKSQALACRRVVRVS